MNDLWLFNLDDNQWLAVTGSDAADHPGVYGTQGAVAPGNQPGGRYDFVTWKDNKGRLWLYGGEGFDSAGAEGNLGDLWMFENREWVWMRGSDTTDHRVGAKPGVYGTMGVAAASTVAWVRLQQQTLREAAFGRTVGRITTGVSGFLAERGWMGTAVRAH